MMRIHLPLKINRSYQFTSNNLSSQRKLVLPLGSLKFTFILENFGNSPVCRHLDLLPIEGSAKGRNDGDERQETPCTLLACQTCLEPKHLG